MAEYIEREEVLALKYHSREYNSRTKRFDLPVVDAYAILEIPAADVQPVRHGRWIPHMESIETTVITASRVYEKGDSVQYGFTCSECGRWEENREPFCNCGAKMDKEEP